MIVTYDLEVMNLDSGLVEPWEHGTSVLSHTHTTYVNKPHVLVILS